MGIKKCAAAWRIADAKIHECFGDFMRPGNPMPAPLVYGHLACGGNRRNIPWTAAFKCCAGTMRSRNYGFARAAVKTMLHELTDSG